MPLSNQDNLRLNVLCAQAVKVIRINDSRMLLNALTDRGEVSIVLDPNTRHDAYLREVREFLSEKFLGIPGGFPRHLQVWSRMGDSNHSLDKMLLLGEREAIVALACSGQLNAEQAGYAWWAAQSPEVARKLLKIPEVVASDLGIELAQFLLEFLPFEAQPLDVVQSVMLCLQGDLLKPQQRNDLWDKARRKNPYFVGFLLAGPQAIPADEAPHPAHQACLDKLDAEIQENNDYALNFIHFLSPEGRKWLKSLQLALKKPGDPDVVIALFIGIDRYISIAVGPSRGTLEFQTAASLAAQLCSENSKEPDIDRIYPRLDTTQKQQFEAMLILAQLGEHTLNRYFGGRDASGTVMRKNLKPLIGQINTTINSLLQP